MGRVIFNKTLNFFVWWGRDDVDKNVNKIRRRYFCKKNFRKLKKLETAKILFALRRRKRNFAPWRISFSALLTGKRIVSDSIEKYQSYDSSRKICSLLGKLSENVLFKLFFIFFKKILRIRFEIFEYLLDIFTIFSKNLIHIFRHFELIRTW